MQSFPIARETRPGCFGIGKTISIFLSPTMSVSLKTKCRMASSGFTQGPPLPHQPGPAPSNTLMPNRSASWTPNTNAYVDPEISTFGTGIESEFGESFATPSQRTYGTTLKITF